MADMDTLRTILHARNITLNNVKPYTGFRIQKNGNLVLTTPSLDSYRVNNDPRYRYERNMSAKDVDYRLLSYDALEGSRYQSLGLKQPTPDQVTRIFQERFGTVASPRRDSSTSLRTSSMRGYQPDADQIPDQSRTMVSQRFNKLSPFVTEQNINARSTVRRTIV